MTLNPKLTLHPNQVRDFAKDVPVTGAAVPSGGSKSEPDGDGDG